MEAIFTAVGYLYTLDFWIFITLGVILSAVVGIVPGVGSLLTMAILIPFLVVNVEDPAMALIMFATITGANNTLDSIPAVVAGIPGSSTQVTFLEGHQAAQQGRAAYTLGAVYGSSMIGGVIGAAFIAVLIPVIRPLIMEFTYAEIAMVALFGVGMVAALSHGAVIKGMAAAFGGLLIATVGIDPMTGVLRFGFDRSELFGGLPLVATMTGIFAIPEMIDLIMTRKPVAPPGMTSTLSQREIWRGAVDSFKRPVETARQSIFGVLLGAIPGVGGSVIDWLAYAFGIVFRKDRSEFGKGSVDGVRFAEAAQNSKEAGQAVPTLALGIPGGTGWIMVIVAMMAYGVSPGPSMLGVNAHLTILIIFALAISNIMMTGLGLSISKPLVSLTRIPYAAIAAVIVPLSFLAAYLNMLNWFAIPIILVFSVVGFLMKRFGWPRPPFVLGFILGPIVDENFQSALSFYGLGGILTRPATVVLLVLAIGFSALFYYLMNRASITQVVPALASDDNEIASQVPGLAPIDGNRRPQAQTATARQTAIPRFVWRPEAAVTLFFLASAVPFFWVAVGNYPFRAALLPMAFSSGLFVFGLIAFLRQTFRREVKAADIMDIGMRSKGVEGATRAGLLFLAMVGMMLFLMMLIGLQWASVVFAAALPLILMEGPARWRASVVATIVMLIWTQGFMEYFMATIWPTPVLGEWLRGLFS